uniref:Uncharacterized protein n=1 Tax=Mos8Chu0 chuvirus TaxID=2847850 RepID=A0A1L4A1T2_9VIRU|nr:hypothetical protein [Mos8Chu0 chuvirus]
MSDDRQNRSALFSGALEPAISEFPSAAAGRHDHSGQQAEGGAGREGFGTARHSEGRGRVAAGGGRAVVPIGVSIMEGIMDSSSGAGNQGRSHTASRGGHSTSGAGFGSRRARHHGVQAEGEQQESNVDKQLQEILAVCKKNSDSIDGIFAEVRALSGNVMQMRQELVILKESSARFPSATVGSTVNRVPIYDP